MLTIVPILTTCLVIITIHGLFVAAKFSMVSLRRSKLSQMVEEGETTATRLLPLIEDKQLLEKFVITCQLGMSISILILGFYGQQAISTLLIPWLNQFEIASELVIMLITGGIVWLALAAVHTILGELLPKTAALQYPEAIALWTLRPILGLILVSKPFIWLAWNSGRLLLRLLHLPNLYEQLIIPQEIETLITESHEGGLLADEEQQLLRNAFRLRDLTARQVMRPRTQIIAASVDSTVFDLMTLSIKEGYSRLPLYDANIDNMVGFVHIKDLFKLYLKQESSPKSVLRQISKIPETMTVATLWETLNRTHQYMTIVFDEYGGTAGLITFEDLLEEIFGEFQDEFDNDELPMVSADKSGRLYLRGDLLIADVNDYLSLNLPEDAADTIGGLIFLTLGRPPQITDEVCLGVPEVAIRVEALNGRWISEVSLHLTSQIDNQLGNWEVESHE